MATHYHASDSGVGMDPTFSSRSGRKVRHVKKPRRISSFSYISERIEIIRLSSTNSRSYSRPDVPKIHHKGSGMGCLRHCFLLRCFEFLGSPTVESEADNEVDDVEYGPIRYVPHSLASLTRSTNFTKEELKTLYRTFKNECPTGVVYEDTLKSIYSQFFPSGDANMYAHYLFNAFDNNQEGYICFEDFVTSLSSLLRGKFEEKLQWVFKLYDINHDGLITKEEMQDIVKSVYSLLGTPGESASLTYSYMEHANRVFRKLDRNNDGYVTYPEFVDACSRDPSVVASMKIFEAQV